MKFCSIDEQQLEGYCTACAHLHPGSTKHRRSSPHKEQSLLTRLQHALNAQNKKVAQSNNIQIITTNINIITDDNLIKCGIIWLDR